jgi:hypothetical protein
MSTIPATSLGYRLAKMRQLEPPNDCPAQRMQIDGDIGAGARKRRLAAAPESGTVVDTNTRHLFDPGNHVQPTRAKVQSSLPGKQRFERSLTASFDEDYRCALARAAIPQLSRPRVAVTKARHGFGRWRGRVELLCEGTRGDARKENGGREYLQNSIGRH